MSVQTKPKNVRPVDFSVPAYDTFIEFLKQNGIIPQNEDKDTGTIKKKQQAYLESIKSLDMVNGSFINTYVLDTGEGKTSVLIPLTVLVSLKNMLGKIIVVVTL